MGNFSEYIEAGIRSDCKEYKARASGSGSEYAIQRHFAKLLGQWSDHVVTEDFCLHPAAFLGWIPLCVITELTAIGFLWASRMGERLQLVFLGLALSVLGILMVWFEFFRYRKFVDFLFPKRTSHNVYAVRRSAGLPKKRIILGGHADAAYEFRYIYLAKGKLSMPMIYASLTGMVAVLTGFAAVLLWRMRWIQSPALCYAAAVLASLFVPVWIGMLFFTNWKRITDGANDNLSACYAAFSVMKYLQENNIRFADTEVCCLISGGEEAGLRGAEAFAERHKEELRAIETVFIAMDTLREREQLMVYTSGMYGLQKSSRAVGRLLQRAAAELEITLPEAPPYPGAMDSDAFSRQGFLACGLGAVDHNPQPYYHTRMDTAENVDAGCIALCAEICLKAITNYAAQGLPQQP